MYEYTLNWRNKLEQQNLQQNKYLVVYGAGGGNICSAYLFIDDADKYVIDQTLYWTIVDTEEEAIYLSAILNCPTLNNIISSLQPQGGFGERHVHTLPLQYIPRYNHKDSRHIELVNKAKILFNELYSKLSHDLIDPNKGTLASRRKRISNILSSLPSYTLYFTLCKSILEKRQDSLNQIIMNESESNSGVISASPAITKYPDYEPEMLMAAEDEGVYKTENND